jgi:hypothetical protein
MSEYLEKIEQREGEERYLCGISTVLLLGTWEISATTRVKMDQFSVIQELKTIRLNAFSPSFLLESKEGKIVTNTRRR